MYNSNNSKDYYISELKKAQKVHARAYEYQQYLRNKLDEIEKKSIK